MADKKRIHSPSPVSRENVEIEKMYIMSAQREVVGLHGTSLKCPTVTGEFAFRLDQPNHGSRIEPLVDITAGQFRIPEAGHYMEVLRAEFL
jgi:hypothetical protein